MDYLSQFNVKNFLSAENKNKSKIKSDTLEPKISIVIASFNQGKFLERTILSILNQLYKNHEIIIIDGASTDNSVEIIKKYESLISYWVSEKDNGQTHAINKGLKIATGNLLCFQNSDDLFCENSFEILADFYLKNPNYDCYFGDLLLIDADDNVTDILRTSEYELKSQIIEGVQVFNQSFYFKKSVVERFGYLNESLRFVLDYENVLRWSYLGAKFIKVKNLLGAFRTHEDAKTSNLQNVRVTEHEIIKSNYFDLVFKNKKNIKLVYLYLRLKKLVYFIKNNNIAYLIYRFKKNNEA